MPTSFLEGANCQRFAYAVLSLFGVNVPAFRSSDLWVDRCFTFPVDEPRALDLVLFGGGENAWGAHVGVYLGNERVLHLCKEAGVPAVWTLDEFKSKRRYRGLVGFKRVLAEPMFSRHENMVALPRKGGTKHMDICAQSLDFRPEQR